MKELMAVESALFSAGRALDATEVAEGAEGETPKEGEQPASTTAADDPKKPEGDKKEADKKQATSEKK